MEKENLEKQAYLEWKPNPHIIKPSRDLHWLITKPVHVEMASKDENTGFIAIWYGRYLKITVGVYRFVFPLRAEVQLALKFVFGDYFRHFWVLPLTFREVVYQGKAQRLLMYHIYWAVTNSKLFKWLKFIYDGVPTVYSDEPLAICELPPYIKRVCKHTGCNSFEQIYNALVSFPYYYIVNKY